MRSGCRTFIQLIFSVYAYVNGDHITIPYQVVDGYAVEGVATYFGNGIDSPTV